MSNEAIRASIDAFTATTSETLTKVGQQLDAIEATNEQLQAVLRRPGGKLTAANDNEPGDIKAERTALTAFGRTGDNSKLGEISASMSVGNDPSGGYLALPAISEGWTKKLFDQSPMRRLARVVTVEAKEFVEPIDKDEAEAGWVGEQTARPELDTPDLAMLTVPVEEQYTNLKVTQRLLDDASFDVGAWLNSHASDKFARSEATAFINGAGIIQPRGLLTYATSTAVDASRPWGTIQTVASGASGAVNEVGLKNAVWGLRAPYRAGASWIMNSATASTLNSLKTSGGGEYLWRPSMASGVPDELLGYPVAICEDMPDVTGNSLSVAFGNFALSYVIAERPGIKLLRDPYSNKPYVFFYFYRRVGGGLANSEAVKLIKTQ